MKKNYFIHIEKLIKIVVVALIAFTLVCFFITKLKSCFIDKTEKISKFSMKSSNVILNKIQGEPKIRVYITKEDKIKELKLEDYVAGVVCAEIPAEFHVEALKAQAIAARTFALAHLEQCGGKKYKSNTGADVSDTVQCQVYMEKETKFKDLPKNKREEYWRKIVKAVGDTSGEFLVYNGTLVKEPYYFAVSGGKTESAMDVFSSGEPYLKSVSSPGEERARKYKSLVKTSYYDFKNKINSKYPNSLSDLHDINEQIFVVSKTSGGYVKEIKVGSTTISGNKFREIMGLNSAKFTVEFKNKYVYINCLGYGHGVGMSQWGADAMAKKGESYKDILKHYYTGIEVDKIEY